jgi:hypothetical protein
VAAQNIPWDADRATGVVPAPLVRRDLHTTEKSIRNQLLALGQKPFTLSDLYALVDLLLGEGDEENAA